MIKSTGMVRNVDSLGRIVLPKELRKTLGMPENEPLEIFVDGNRIILQKYAPGCILCGSIEAIHPFRNKAVCESCLDDLSKISVGPLV